MKILIVASYRAYRQSMAAFVTEQGEALRAAGHEVEYFPIHGFKRSAIAYLRHVPKLVKKINEFKPNVVHAHYGLSGLLANMQRLCPVVTTYHGSDVNRKRLRQLSKISVKLSAWNIFVSKRSMQKVNPKSKYSLVPCGISLDAIQLFDKAETRKKLGWGSDVKYIIFTSAFNNTVKDAPLAHKAVETYKKRYGKNAVLVELNGYDRRQVTELMCAADALILTSKMEGSPQVIKEAMACCLPIVSVDVGDVKERVENVKHSYVAESRTEDELAHLLNKAIEPAERTNGREYITKYNLENRQVAQTLTNIYVKLTKPKYLQ